MNGEGGIKMKMPTRVNHSEIAQCQFLKCEDTCYGIICYCDIGAWGQAPCSREVQEACEKDHHIIM